MNRRTLFGMLSGLFAIPFVRERRHPLEGCYLGLSSAEPEEEYEMDEKKLSDDFWVPPERDEPNGISFWLGNNADGEFHDYSLEESEHSDD